MRLDRARAVRATRTKAGPATLALEVRGTSLLAEARGPGADAALAARAGVGRPGRRSGPPPIGPSGDTRVDPAHRWTPDRPHGSGHRGAGAGDPRAEGHRREAVGGRGAGWSRGTASRRPGRSACGSVPAAGGAGARCPTTPSIRWASSGAARTRSAGPRRGRPGWRRSSTCPIDEAYARLTRAARASARGRRPRSPSARSATRTRSASATSTCRTSWPARWPASRAATTRGCSSCSSRGAGSGRGWSGCSS